MENQGTDAEVRSDMDGKLENDYSCKIIEVMVMLCQKCAKTFEECVTEFNSFTARSSNHQG